MLRSHRIWQCHRENVLCGTEGPLGSWHPEELCTVMVGGDNSMQQVGVAKNFPQTQLCLLESGSECVCLSGVLLILRTAHVP